MIMKMTTTTTKMMIMMYKTKAVFYCLFYFRRSLRPYEVKAVLIEPGAHQTAMTTQESFKTRLSAAWNGASSAAKAEYGEGFLKAGNACFLSVCILLCDTMLKIYM